MKYSSFKIIGLGLGSFLALILVGFLLTFFGFKNIVQGNTATGLTQLRLSKPVSWLTSRLTLRTNQTIETWHVINRVLTSGGKYLVLLQNSDEIRATGGFIGSYTVLDLDSSEPLRLQLRDMYDPSGVSQTLSSPPGQKEYLSEGQGMKLVDANWNPDFPASAKLILDYFAAIAGDPQHYDGVIALPLTSIEQLISALGGVYLVDEQQTITGETLAAQIRRDRDQFFDGSQQKAQSLQAVYTALKIKLGQLTISDWRQLLTQFNRAKSWQTIQIYTQDDRLQTDLRYALLTGELLAYGSDEIYLFPVESNVGINKANRKVTRQLKVAIVDNELTMITKWHNAYTASERPPISSSTTYLVAPHLAYVNYHRVLVNPQLTVQSVLVDGELSSWDEELLTGVNGLIYRQIGFLVVVPEESEAQVEVKFDLPQPGKSQPLIQRQVGLLYTSISDSIE
ncbi:MAG TPA: DUF4012 domain-containing protein [Patescibacteria group bacterium]